MVTPLPTPLTPPQRAALTRLLPLTDGVTAEALRAALTMDTHVAQLPTQLSSAFQHAASSYAARAAWQATLSHEVP